MPASQASRLYGPGQHNTLRRHHRHVARPDGRVGGLPVSERLAPGHGRDAAAGDRVGARRQQHLRLHRRPGLRRREPGADRQRRHRHRQLPARRPRLLQPRTAQDGRCRRRLRQLRAARHHQGAAVRQSQHRELRRRSGQRHADGRVGRRGQRLRGDDVADAGQGQPRARAQAAADERRHFAGQRTASWQRPDARAGIGLSRSGRSPAESAVDRRWPGGRRSRGDGAGRVEDAGGDRILHAEQERRCDLDHGRDEAGADGRRWLGPDSRRRGASAESRSPRSSRGST